MISNVGDLLTRICIIVTYKYFRFERRNCTYKYMRMDSLYTMNEICMQWEYTLVYYRKEIIRTVLNNEVYYRKNCACVRIVLTKEVYYRKKILLRTYCTYKWVYYKKKIILRTYCTYKESLLQKENNIAYVMYSQWKFTTERK